MKTKRRAAQTVRRFFTVIELGKRGVSLNLIEDCASVLGVAVADLFAEEKNESTTLIDKKIRIVKAVSEIERDLTEKTKSLIHETLRKLEKI